MDTQSHDKESPCNFYNSSYVSANFCKAFKDFLKHDLEKEFAKALKDKATKEEIADISKKVIKKLYRELFFNYPYIIDRVKI